MYIYGSRMLEGIGRAGRSPPSAAGGGWRTQSTMWCGEFYHMKKIAEVGLPGLPGLPPSPVTGHRERT